MQHCTRFATILCPPWASKFWLQTVLRFVKSKSLQLRPNIVNLHRASCTSRLWAFVGSEPSLLKLKLMNKLAQVRMLFSWLRLHTLQERQFISSCSVVSRDLSCMQLRVFKLSFFLWLIDWLIEVVLIRGYWKLSLGFTTGLLWRRQSLLWEL